VTNGNGIVVRISVGPLAGPVLSRVVSAIAARADLPVDRLQDAVLVADAIAAHVASHVVDGQLVVTVVDRPGGITLRVGPLVPGGGHGLVNGAVLPEVGSVFERLADSVEQDEAGPEEYVTIRLDRRAA
jgi:serine/threonine-protein kinase RsbW